MLSRILLIFGIGCILFASLLVVQRTNPNRISFNGYIPSNETSIRYTQPTRLRLKNVAIDVPVIPAKIQNNTWQLTDKGISYLATSPLPGQRGNSIMYGHNWASILGNLDKTKIGQEIEVDFANNTTKYFTITGILVVNPSNTSVLLPSTDNRLTLYTCTGFFDTKRLVITAVLKPSLPLCPKDQKYCVI